MLAQYSAILLPLAMGFAFGVLLQRSRVTNFAVIENQFCLCDFTMLKVMLPAIVVGGVGVWFLIGQGNAHYHIKEANLLGVALGGLMFGLAVVLCGYCPGSGLAAVGTGSVHALVGVLGMIAGGIAYAFSYDWLKAHVLNVWALGKVRLPDLTGVPDVVWLSGLGVIALALFIGVERRGLPM